MPRYGARSGNLRVFRAVSRPDGRRIDDAFAWKAIRKTRGIMRTDSVRAERGGFSGIFRAAELFEAEIADSDA